MTSVTSSMQIVTTRTGPGYAVHGNLPNHGRFSSRCTVWPSITGGIHWV